MPVNLSRRLSAMPASSAASGILFGTFPASERTDSAPDRISESAPRTAGVRLSASSEIDADGANATPFQRSKFVGMVLPCYCF